MWRSRTTTTQRNEPSTASLDWRVTLSSVERLSKGNLDKTTLRDADPWVSDNVTVPVNGCQALVQYLVNRYGGRPHTVHLKLFLERLPCIGIAGIFQVAKRNARQTVVG